ncbi:hypothetical protein Naga_100555g1 [Nannochloropsis gaditana]|uniref:Uncharacterized protein n=1 Tax=Nannochloropsis gaditana TaxID=72520 RepID=W7TFC2_9STRA|nr:hypothetical protein Naga_100555g1 [Nannochloropsis gaditana]
MDVRAHKCLSPLTFPLPVSYRLSPPFFCPLNPIHRVVSPFLSPHVPLRSLSTKTFKHLLASPNIRVRHENTLFLLFQIYFAQKEDWQGDTPEEREKSRRAAVEEVLPSLRFPRMSSDFLSDVVAHSSLFAESPSATHLLVEALAYKSLSRLRQDRWIRLVRNELRIEHKAAQFKINQKAGIKPCPSEVQAAVREAESASSFNPVKSEPFRGTDVESCFSRLQDRTAVLQSQFITFAVDFSLQACLQLQPNQGLFSAVHECCGYLWTVQLVRLPIASIAPPSNPQAIRPSPSTCFTPSSSDRMGLWLHLLPMKPYQLCFRRTAWRQPHLDPFRWKGRQRQHQVALSLLSLSAITCGGGTFPQAEGGSEGVVSDCLHAERLFPRTGRGGPGVPRGPRRQFFDEGGGIDAHRGLGECERPVNRKTDAGSCTVARCRVKDGGIEVEFGTVVVGATECWGTFYVKETCDGETSDAHPGPADHVVTCGRQRFCLGSFCGESNVYWYWNLYQK